MAVILAIQCRCGVALRSAPYHRLSKQHCASESFSSFHIFHFPSYILPSITTSPFFPPSEGAQDPLVFVPLSEGVRKRHSFESALCPCFSCRRAFPTFRRRAGSPRFRPTFRRCAEASQLRERPVSAFSCRRAFPTFRRCAGSPRFRLTFRRCAEASQLRKRPVSVFLLPPCVSHLPKVCSIPTFSSHLPKVTDRAFSQVFLVPVD